MTKMYISISSLLLLLFVNCTKVEDMPTTVTPPPTTQTDTLVYAWKTFLSDAGYVANSIEPVVFEDKVMFSEQEFFVDETLKMFNATNGDVLWTWHDFFSQSPSVSIRNGVQIKEDKAYVCSNHRELHSIDLHSGQTNWSYREETADHAGPFSNLVEDHLYFTLGQAPDRPSPFDSIAHLVRTDLDGVSWDTIFTVTEGGSTIPRLLMPDVYHNSNNDEIAVFVYDRSDIDATAGEVYLISWNITQDSLMYQTGSWDDLASVHLPIIEGNKIYIATAKRFYCFDLETGQPIWQKNFQGGNDHLLSSRFTITGNKVILKASNNDLFALNKESGAQVWHKSNAGGATSALKAHNGYVYYSSSSDRKLYAFQIETGKEVWSILPPSYVNDNIDANFGSSGVAIHEELNLLYVADRVYIYALNLL